MTLVAKLFITWGFRRGEIAFCTVIFYQEPFTHGCTAQEKH